MSPVNLAELPAEVCEGSTTLTVFESSEMTVEQQSCMTLGSPTELTNDQLADAVIEGVRKFRHYLPYVIALKERFDTEDRDSTNRLRNSIKMCYSWKEFCEKHLDRTPEAIRKTLKPSPKKNRKSAEPSEPDWRYEVFLSQDEATKLYHTIVDSPDWRPHAEPETFAITYGATYTRDGGGSPYEISEIPPYLQKLANRVSENVGMPVNYIQCHKKTTNAVVTVHPDPKMMVVPMICVGQERTFQVGGHILGANGKPFPRMASQSSMKNGTHVPAEEILLQHGSLLVFNGGHTFHSMLPADQDPNFNPNGFDYRISILFRWTTPAMREFGSAGAVEHGSVEQYEEVKRAYRQQIGWKATVEQPWTPEVTEEEIAEYEAAHRKDVRQSARNMRDKGMPPTDVVGALVNMNIPKPMAEAAVRIVAPESDTTAVKFPTTESVPEPTNPSRTTKLREWFATKCRAFVIQTAASDFGCGRMGRYDLTLKSLTVAEVKKIGTLLGETNHGRPRR